MRLTFLLMTFSFFVMMSCSNSTTEIKTQPIDTSLPEDSTLTEKAPKEIVEEVIIKPINWVGEDPMFFVPVNAFGEEDEVKAQTWVKDHQEKGEKVGYLWIPTFQSLSGAKKFAVGYGTFNNIEKCIAIVDSLREAGQPGVYGVRIDEDGHRMEIRGKNKIKLNGESVDLINDSTPQIVLIFDPAVHEEASEDWGYFAGQVQSACMAKGIHVEAAYENFENIEVKAVGEVIAELDVTEYVANGRRGYIAIHGYKRKFIEHDMPGGVLGRLSNFFDQEIDMVPFN